MPYHATTLLNEDTVEVIAYEERYGGQLVAAVAYCFGKYLSDLTINYEEKKVNKKYVPYKFQVGAEVPSHE